MIERPGVGIVFVSHSETIADGLVTLARQAAPATVLVAAGGDDRGGLGTSFDVVSRAIRLALGSGDVVILCDLGSAILTAATAIDMLSDSERSRVRLADAPLVEGGVAAAVAAESGDALDAVVRAAESMSPRTAPNAIHLRPGGDGLAAVRYRRIVTLVNNDGLHARPAAEFVKLASTFSERVTVNGRDAKSLLGIMSLGLAKGASAEICSLDEGGEAPVNALAALVESGFGEVRG